MIKLILARLKAINVGCLGFGGNPKAPTCFFFVVVF